jgi:hypothetical protein
LDINVSPSVGTTRYLVVTLEQRSNGMVWRAADIMVFLARGTRSGNAEHWGGDSRKNCAK